MTIYILFVITLIALLILNSLIKTDIQLFQKIAFIFIVFFVGFRFETGYDWAMYRNFFEYDTFHHTIEFGYVFFIKFLRVFFSDFQSLFFFTALATYLFLYLGIKKYTNHSSIAVLIFVLIPGLFLNTFSIMRQELAIVIAFYAFSFLRDKKFFIYLLLMILAFSFHYTVAIAFVTHLLVWKYAPKVKYNYYYYLILFSMLFLGFNIGNLVYYFAKGARYEFYQAGESVSLIKILILNTLALVYVYLSPKIIEKNKYNIYIVALFVMNIVYLNIFSSVIALSRFSYYFKIFEIVLVAELLFIFDKKIRVLALISLVLLYSVLYIGALKVDMAETRTVNNLVPYKNIFFDK
ncbi:EpsG family protein [Acinetobacter sp.]|uniref:EpsG family protein n=1 Tax=Acinetobacter sp. TaxID=472 RepID=UPI0033425F29